MNREITRDRQLPVSNEVAADLKRRQNAETARLADPPRPGDTFLSHRTAAFPVEWLMVEDDEDGRVLVVPLDDHPFAGSRDLELPARSLGGAVVLRCDLDAWLDAESLEPELRTGALSAAELEQVRRKRRAIEEDALEPTLLEEEVDGDPEYRRWRDGTLWPALAALIGSAEPLEPEERDGPTVAAVPIDGPPAAQGRRRWLLLAAAAALAAIALPTAWQLHRLSQEVSHRQARIAELEKERRALEDRLAASESGRESPTNEGSFEAALQEAQETSARALDKLKAQLEARLRRALVNSIEVNPLRLVLARMDRTRAASGEAQEISLGDAHRLMLSLKVEDPTPYPRYRLRVVEKAGEEIWRTDELVKVGDGWLHLELPIELFEAEEYELLIYGLGSDSPELLEERYTVKFER